MAAWKFRAISHWNSRQTAYGIWWSKRELACISYASTAYTMQLHRQAHMCIHYSEQEPHPSSCGRWIEWAGHTHMGIYAHTSPITVCSTCCGREPPQARLVPASHHLERLHMEASVWTGPLFVKKPAWFFWSDCWTLITPSRFSACKSNWNEISVAAIASWVMYTDIKADIETLLVLSLTQDHLTCYTTQHHSTSFHWSD